MNLLTLANMVFLSNFLAAVLFSSSMNAQALLFREDQFTDVTQSCKGMDRKRLSYILNEDNPALYISVDPSHPIKTLNKKLRRVDQSKLFGNMDSRILQDLVEVKRPWVANLNTTFDCVLQIETELPKGDKTGEKYDALSLIIIELNYSAHLKTPNYIEISTFGHEGHTKKKVTKKAHYSDRMWAATNPNFLLSGQLSGFDSIDYRTKVDPQHIIKPEFLHSTFDKPASITVNISQWNWHSHVYMVFTSYKYLRQGELCHEIKEFDCSPRSFLSPANDHMCMNSNLACDGLPNCGQDYLPNQDENCFKIHWSSVLLSLVSYILLAITLLLCLSCFARVLIQWSVRSSLAELRGGIPSPTGSFRSSSRFFSFLGNTFTSRWERPPPTYDEAMKHVNPDIARPQDPPAYSDTFSSQTEQHSGAGATGGGASAANSHTGIIVATTERVPSSRLRQTSSCGTAGSASVGIIETPPPEYDSQEALTHPFLEIGTHQAPSSPPSSSSSSLSVAAAATDLAMAPTTSSSSPNVSSSCSSILHPSVVILPPTPVTFTTNHDYEFGAAASASSPLSSSSSVVPAAAAAASAPTNDSGLDYPVRTLPHSGSIQSFKSDISSSSSSNNNSSSSSCVSTVRMMPQRPLAPTRGGAAATSSLSGVEPMGRNKPANSQKLPQSSSTTVEAEICPPQSSNSSSSIP